MTFEGYLKEIHMENNPTILDDDLPDAYNDWVASLQADDFIAFADNYVQHLMIEIQTEIQKVVKK